jgi:glycerophosphoryl diester phosphodiesterase
VRTASLVGLLLLAACRTPLREPVAMIRGAPPLEAGFYAVHAVEAGRVRETPGAAPLGTVLYLHPRKYVRKGFWGTPKAFFTGIGGVCRPEGRLRSELHDGEVRHFYQDPGSRRTERIVFKTLDPLTLEVGGATVVLRYRGRRLPGLPQTVFLAHRGSCYQPPLNRDGLYPSNTVPAFEMALEEGYQGFELDVHVTRDRKFVVSHDEALRVATDGKGQIRERSLKELKRLTVLRSTRIPEMKASATTAYIAAPLPGLKEVLARFLPDERVERIVIDVKPDSDENLLAAAREAFTGTSEPDQGKLIFLTRSEGFIAGLRAIVPRATFALEGHLGTEPLNEPQSYLPESVGRPRGEHDAISINVRLLTSYLWIDWGLDRLRYLMDQARKYGYAVVGWTVSDEDRMERLRRKGLWPDYALSDAPYARIAADLLRAGE